MSVAFECVVGDIARQPDIDAVVNAANAELGPGGGVAGALHRAAGPALARACRPLAPIRPGEAVITPAFRLPNRFVLHCLGPVYGVDHPEAELLASCYRRALRLAREFDARSVAFPAISAGSFGYSLATAAGIAIASVRAAARARPLRSSRRPISKSTGAFWPPAPNRCGSYPNWCGRRSCRRYHPRSRANSRGSRVG